MKKKLFLGIGVLVGVVALVVTVTKVNLNFDKGSGLQLSNIEAYASDSEGGKWKLNNLGITSLYLSKRGNSLI